MTPNKLAVYFVADMKHLNYSLCCYSSTWQKSSQRGCQTQAIASMSTSSYQSYVYVFNFIQWQPPFCQSDSSQFSCNV